MSRVVVTLNSVEREALIKLAAVEIRTPRDQARYILRQELEQRGLLPADDQGFELRAVETTQNEKVDHGRTD